MAVYPGDFPYSLSLYRYHEHTGDFYTKSNPGFAHSQEIIITSMHAGTHVDALCHMSKNGLLYGGVNAASLEYHNGFRKLGIEAAGIFFLKAHLLDVAAQKKLEALPPKYDITPKDLQASIDAQDTRIEPGDAILIRTGYSKLFTTDPQKYVVDFPGVGIKGSEWLAKLSPKLVAADNLAFGLPPARVHEVFIVKHGIYMLKNINLEEMSAERQYTSLLIVAPLKALGATGSLVRPIAIAPRTE